MSPPHLLCSPLIIKNCANAPHSGRNLSYQCKHCRCHPIWSCWACLISKIILHPLLTLVIQVYVLWDPTLAYPYPISLTELQHDVPSTTIFLLSGTIAHIFTSEMKRKYCSWSHFSQVGNFTGSPLFGRGIPV